MALVDGLIQGSLVLVGGLITILTAIWVEQARKPHLRINLAEPIDGICEGQPPEAARWVNVQVVNEPPSRWLRWLSRQMAVQCRGTATFHHLDGQAYLDRATQLRWSASPQPIPSRLVANDGQVIAILVDYNRLTTDSWIDIPPGEQGAVLNVAARIEDDSECYPWSNESYLSSPRWRNPKWRLPPGRYLVKIAVVSLGEECTAVFRLVNDVPRQDFRLELPQPGDRVRGGSLVTIS